MEAVGSLPNCLANSSSVIELAICLLKMMSLKWMPQKSSRAFTSPSKSIMQKKKKEKKRQHNARHLYYMSAMLYEN